MTEDRQRPNARGHNQNRHYFSVFCFLLLATPTTNAAFSRFAHWRLDTIEQTYAGARCFHPGAKPTPGHACIDSTLGSLLDAHIMNDQGSGLSIAYYDLADRSVLGGAGWADWDNVVLPVGLCMSGAIGGLVDVYSTICRFSITDDDHDMPSAHIQECAAGRS